MAAWMSYVTSLFSVISAILMVLFGSLKPVQPYFVVMWDCCTDLSRICGAAARLVK